MRMKASLEGKYKGKERVHTPAGDFDCIKIYTESKAKFMLSPKRIQHELVCQRRRHRKGRKIQQTGEITGEHDAGSHTEAGK